jgi:hypothetical protein
LKTYQEDRARATGATTRHKTAIRLEVTLQTPLLQFGLQVVLDIDVGIAKIFSYLLETSAAVSNAFCGTH